MHLLSWEYRLDRGCARTVQLDDSLAGTWSVPEAIRLPDTRSAYFLTSSLTTDSCQFDAAHVSGVRPSLSFDSTSAHFSSSSLTTACCVNLLEAFAYGPIAA